MIGFNASDHTVNEVDDIDSVIDICVKLMSGSIAPDVLVTYTLTYSEPIPTTQG